MSASQRRASPAAGRGPLARLAAADFARRLRKLMAERNLNQSDLAKEIWGTVEDKRGYEVAKNRDRISVWTRGGVVPDNKNLEALAKALEVTVEELAPQLIGDAIEREEESEMAMFAIPGSDQYHVRINQVLPRQAAIRLVGFLNSLLDELKDADDDKNPGTENPGEEKLDGASHAAGSREPPPRKPKNHRKDATAG